MKKFVTKLMAICLVLVMSMGIVVTAGEKETAASYVRYVTVDFLNIRAKASASSSILGKYYWKDEVTCTGTSGDCTKVSFEGEQGYVSTK